MIWKLGLFKVMEAYEIHLSSSTILHTKISHFERLKHKAAYSHYSILLNMTNGGPLLLNPILYMPYYNALLFSSVEELDHKKPVSWKINLHFDNRWTAFHWGGSPFTLYLPFFYFETVCELSFNAFFSAAFVPNVLARLTSLSPACGKHIYVLFWFVLFHFCVIRHSTATKAENKAPIMLEAICSLWTRWHLVVKAENRGSSWNPAKTKGGPADTMQKLHQRDDLQLSAMLNLEKEPNSEQEQGTYTTSQTSKDTCNRHLKHFPGMRRRFRPWFF